MSHATLLHLILTISPLASDGHTPSNESPTATARGASKANGAGAEALAPRFVWADYDGDGHIDAFVIAPEGGASLLHNLGGADFEDVTLSVGLAALGDEAHQGAWADYDSDGRLDLLLASYTGPSHLLRQNEGGSFEEVTALSGLPPLARVLDASWFDQDGNGDPDLFVTTLDDVHLFRNSAGVLNEDDG